MEDILTSRPPAPDLPTYLQESLETQPPERLESIADYAAKLAAWKQTKREHELEQKRSEEAVDDEELEELEDREITTDSNEYEDVSTSGTYITIKETKPGYHYWQWRDGDSWENEYIASVNPKRNRES